MVLYALVTGDEEKGYTIARGTRQKLRVYTSLGHALHARRWVSGSKVMEFNSGKLVELKV